jgi:hypothetical protein
VRVSAPGETGQLHVVGGTQRDNMIRMARTGRGAVGSRFVALMDAPRGARSLAQREAVRNGWDVHGVIAAPLGSGEPTLW